RQLHLDDIHGQLIIMPAANAAAARAGRRTSPLDGGNLNRSFPGLADGSPTAMLAHFIETVLLPEMDFVFDFHSGGSSLEYVPSAVIVRDDGQPRFAQALELLRLFGFPVGIVAERATGGDRSLAAACGRAGRAICFSTELGGGGTLSLDVLAR